MVKANTKFLTFFLLLMLNLFSCNNTLAYHIFVHVREISEASRSILLEHKNGHKVLNDNIYGQILWNATEEEKEFCKKIHGKVIKDSDKLYSEVLNLSKRIRDIKDRQEHITYNHIPCSNRVWANMSGERDECIDRINEILHSLAK